MKRIISLLLFVVLFLFSINPAQAALVDINSSGNITLNVLSATTDGLKVKSIANARFDPNNSKINLSNSNGKLELVLESSKGNRNLDVTDLDQEIIEIEKYFTPQTISIKAGKDKFIITQSEISVETDFPIEINTKDKKILVKSDSGYQYLNTLPLDVVNSLNLLEIISSPISLALTQNQRKELIYSVSGNKNINVLGVYDYQVPVSAEVSVSTGKITKIDGPIWYKIFGFLLV